MSVEFLYTRRSIVTPQRDLSLRAAPHCVKNTNTKSAFLLQDCKDTLSATPTVLTRDLLEYPPPRVFAIIGMSSLGFQLKRALRDNRHHLGEMQTKPLEESPTQKFFPSLIISFIKAG